jgi:hypothetical protein
LLYSSVFFIFSYKKFNLFLGLKIKRTQNKLSITYDLNLYKKYKFNYMLYAITNLFVINNSIIYKRGVNKKSLYYVYYTFGGAYLNTLTNEYNLKIIIEKIQLSLLYYLKGE